MQKNKYTEKTLEKVIKKAELDLEETAENLIINKIQKDLDSVTIEIIEKREVNKSIKDIIYQLLKNIGFKTSIKINNINKIPVYEINSNNDSILIGKNGQNLNSLRTIVAEILKKELKVPYKFSIDVSDYNQKRINNLINLATNIAKEVQKSKIPARLDSMNSYERMIIHNSLKEKEGIYTESIGEEPNRYIMIKPKED